MGKGGGQPTATKQEITQTNLPEYVRPYFERLLQRTESEAKRDYEPYGGQRIADTSQDLLTSEDMVRDIASTGLPGIQTALDRVGQSIDFTPRQFTAEEAEKYMSPFQQQVTDRAKQAAIDDYRQQIAGGRASAIAAGAFGGSREGVQRALGEEALYDRLADIDVQGRQQAFDKASSLFQADRAADFQGQQLGLGAANQFANLSERARAGDVDAARMLEQIGKAQMARDQASLDMGYQDFMRQQAYPQEKLGLFSSVLRGIPVTPSQTTSTRMPYDPFGRAIGLGLTALGGAKYFG
mgnify:FL=1